VREESESPAGTERQSPGPLMFRAMKEDADGCPAVGRSGRTLGIRIEGPMRDNPLVEDGTVAPATGGMSVALDHARKSSKAPPSQSTRR